MVEAIQGNGLLHVTLAHNDLVEQAGLNREDFEYAVGHFKYKGKLVIISHIFDQHLVVNISGQDDTDAKELIDAFSTVMEDKPFCKYDLHAGEIAGIMLTYEWDKVDANGRYEALSGKPRITDLLRI